MTTESYMQFIKWAFIIWMSGIVLLFILLLRKYTFGKWDKNNPNPYVGETLSIPRGFFRGVLTLTLLFFAVLVQIGHMQFEIDQIKVDDIMMAFKMMLAFYFGSKVMHHLASTDKKKTEAIADNINPNTLIRNPVTVDFEEPGSVG